jgi:hypothetical protein
MNPEIILTPEELYYVGKLLKAKYIDYVYIAAMKDIQQNAEAARQDIQRGLSGKGYLSEDFSGDIEIDEKVRTLVEPVLFGNFESSITICEIGETALVKSLRFHRNEKRTVLSVMGGDGLHISEISDDEMKSCVVSLLPKDYLQKTMETGQSVTRESITRVFAFKNMVVGDRAEVKVFFESDGWLCYENENKVSVVEGGYFCDEAYRILKGD